MPRKEINHYFDYFGEPMVKKIGTIFVCVVVLLVLSNCKSKNKEGQEKHMATIDRYDTSELTIQRGMVVFNQHCSSCHNFEERVIGPNLAGVTSSVSKEWLINFIKNPKKSVESGDERAMELYAQYKVYMPSFETIDDKDLEDLLGFIHQFSEAEKKNKNKRPGGILDPIPEKIVESDLTLVVEELLTIPASSESAPLARINKLLSLGTKQGERLFIADLRGKLYEIVDNVPRVYIDLKVEIENFIENPGWGSGLGSFDFHPEFETNGLFYTTHTEPSRTLKADFFIPDSIQTRMQGILTEWKIDNPSAARFSGKKRELLRVDMVTPAHGLQELTFNPTAKKGDADYGLLYLGIGDGGSALSGYSFLCDSPGKIWSSIIRIDPLGRDSRNGKYGIPKDNPFIADGDKLGEIWSYGFRNPHRISWDDSGSGKIFVTNIGQHSLEEVNLLIKGANYGWPVREGTFLFDTDANTEIVYPLPENDAGFTYPVIQFDHDEANAISGGFTYVNDEIQLLKNKYIFGDIPLGTLFYSEVSDIKDGEQAPIYKMGLELNGVATSFGEISKDGRVDLRFGKDSSGELYIFTKSNGKVYKVVGCKSTSSLF